MKCTDCEKTTRSFFAIPPSLRHCRTGFTLLTSLFVLFPSLAGAYSGGTGTREDPYQIATAQDLIDLGQTEDDHARSFVLTADIDLADRVFERAIVAPDTASDGVAIGGHVFTVFDGTPFSGRFDGQGHVIRNLSINDPTASYQGLFGKLDHGAEITNLGLDNVQVTGRMYVGAVVGENESGTISSCYSTGTVRGEEYVGGLVGRNDGFPDGALVSFCYSLGTVIGTKEVGGLVGRNLAGDISSSYSKGSVRGEAGVGGLAGDNSLGSISSSHSTSTVCGSRDVGGLVGQNSRSTISSCYSTGMVSGKTTIGGLAGQISRGTIAGSVSTGKVYGSWSVGGLVGAIHTDGTISSCYSTGQVRGNYWVGGLLGVSVESGTISSSYCSGSVLGVQNAAGLVGYTFKSWSGTISSSFWDIDLSGQTESHGGIGLTSPQMRDRSTYVQADWDLVKEAVNGTEDIWWIPAGGTPRLWWQQGYAFSPHPSNHTSTSVRDLTLQWRAGGPGIQHDVYFGDDEAIVASADTTSQAVFLGRQPADRLGYDLLNLERARTYYWRVDGVSDTDPATVRKGAVWRFTVTDFVVVQVLDDFESYDDHCNRIFFTWQDGRGHSGDEGIDVYNRPLEGCNVAAYAGNNTGATVGDAEMPYVSHVMLRDASQSLPMYYDNSIWPWFSEAERNWSTPQDWTLEDADTLTLYFKGDAENAQDLLYVAVEDSHGGFAVVYHASDSAVRSTEAQVWHISLAELSVLGVDTSAMKKLAIGVGKREDPQFTQNTGKVYIDDIQLTKRVL